MLLTILYKKIISARARRDSSEGCSKYNNLCSYEYLLTPNIFLVKYFCTRSIMETSFLKCGDQTCELYSNSGRT